MKSDPDLPFPQAISAFADCCEAATAVRFPYIIRFGQCHPDCCAIAILFLIGAIPSKAAPLLFFLPLLLSWPA